MPESTRDHNLLLFLLLHVHVRHLPLTSQLAKAFFKSQRLGLQSTIIQASQLRVHRALKEQDNIARNSTADKFDLKKTQPHTWNAAHVLEERTRTGT